MGKYCLGNAKMNLKFKIFAAPLFCLCLAGCAAFAEPRGATLELREPEQPQQINVPAQNNDFVNYTKVAADYKEFGERTPQDERIVTAGAGSNLSAAIPPTI